MGMEAKNERKFVPVLCEKLSIFAICHEMLVLFNVVIALVKTENISIIYLGRMRKIPFDFVSFEYLTINCIARIHVENH